MLVGAHSRTTAIASYRSPKRENEVSGTDASSSLGNRLQNDFLEPLGLTAYRLAKQLGVSRPTITQIVARRREVTAEMALQLARYFGTSAQLWQNLQSQYDLAVPTTKIGKAVMQKIRPRESMESEGRSAAA